MNANVASPVDLKSESEDDCFSSFCDVLETNGHMREIRIGFRQRPSYEAIQDFLEVAKSHHLRFWLTGKGVVIERRA